MDRVDIFGVKLVENGIIQDENTVVFPDQRLDFAAEGFGIGDAAERKNHERAGH
jgi:hypothetical protein